MKKKKLMSLLVILVLLGGVIMLGLSSCGVNKNSREWIEKNRVSDIYKVYPTKNPEDLFKLFPNGFSIMQIYTTPEGITYQLEVEGNPQTGELKGDFLQNPYDNDKSKKLSDVSVENGKVIFSNNASKKNWPIDGFLFQQIAFNREKIQNLKEKKYAYNSNSGVFEISYQFADPTITRLLGKQNQKITTFEITGSGKNIYGRTLIFNFEDKSDFSEMVNQSYD